MKVSLNWLKEYLDLTQSPEEISDALTLSGLEAEGIEVKGDDVILEIGLTPNLGHCMSIVGMARELAATYQLPLKRKKVELEVEKSPAPLQVKIEAKELCHRYCSRVVKGVRVGPSPKWLSERIENAGMRSVNVVVDIGNLVMLETGQPLHMFDYDKLDGGKLIVREASGDSKITTLDEIERSVPDGALLICDARRPVAFAGVMGEFSTAVSENTKNVLIEAAHFTPQAVRKTSKLIQLRSESSLRFERGIDPLGVASAMDLAAKLLVELAQGAADGFVEDVALDYRPQIVEADPRRINQLLGTNLTISEMSGLLKRLEMVVLEESKDRIRLQIPSYRNDLKGEIDIVEEVGRMYGFNNIPRRFPLHNSSTLTHSPLYLFEEEARDKLIRLGLQECLTCDLISPKLAELTAENTLGSNAQIHVLYPASEDQSVLRPSLLPGLLEVVKYNLDRQNTTIAAFEVGHVHFKEKDKYFSEPAAGIILTGKQAPYHFEEKPGDVDFFDLKGYAENFLDSIGLDGATFSQSHLHNFHPGRQARIEIDGVNAGVIGEVHPRHLALLGIGQRVLYAELNLHDLIDLKKTHHRAKGFSVLPSSQRDWTISMLDKTPIGIIFDEIKTLKSSLLENVFLLDVYKSDKIGKDRKNATFRFKYRDQAKTIEYEVVEKEHERLTLHIAEKLENIVP